MISIVDGNKLILGKVFRLYVLSCLYVPLIVQVSNVHIFQILDDVIFILMFFICLVSLFSGISRVSSANYILPAYILFSSVLSFFLENSLAVIILSLKNMKNLFLIFIMACMIRLDLDFVIRCIKFMLYASVPVASAQFILGYYYDDITGLFGPKSSSLLSLTAIVFFVVEYVQRKKYGLSAFGIYLIWLIPIFLNETKISFLLLPIIFAFALYICGMLKISRVLYLGFSMFFLVLFINYLYQVLYGYSFASMFNYDFFEAYFLDYTSLHGDVPRFYRLLVAYNIISSGGFFEYLFGYGIGSVYVGDNGYTLGIISKMLENTALNSGSRIQLFQILIDYGLIGVFFFLSFMAYCLFRSSSSSASIEGLYAALFSLVMLVCLVYQNMFFTKQLSFLYFYFVYAAFLNKQCFTGVLEKKDVL